MSYFSPLCSSSIRSFFLPYVMYCVHYLFRVIFRCVCSSCFISLFRYVVISFVCYCVFRYFCIDVVRSFFIYLVRS